MDAFIAAKVSALRDHISNTNIKLFTSEDEGYDELDKYYIFRPVKNVAIAKPQTAEDVSKLVRFCTSNGLEISVRGGGHDCDGRTKGPGSVMIDMRDIDHVDVAANKYRAHVGGGALLRKVAKDLEAEGLVTPTGTVGSVGYAGWAMLGGYGPFSPSYGLGVDQIVGARVVKANGEIVDADDELLFGIRGAGGTLGIVVQLTIKVYPMGKLLFSTVIFDSGDLEETMFTFNAWYEDQLERGALPKDLQVQPAILEVPQSGIGIVYAVLATWTGSDEDEGRAWIKKVTAVRPCVMEQTQRVPLAEHLENNEKLVAYPSYGKTFTISLNKLTPKTIATFAKFAKTVPGGGVVLSVHTLRHDQPTEVSAFSSREAHHMVEVIAQSGDATVEEARSKWAWALIEELRTQEPTNILAPTYVSLGGDADTDMEKVYGRHYSRVIALKRKYHRDNVFKYAVPRLLPL